MIKLWYETASGIGYRLCKDKAELLYQANYMESRGIKTWF